MSYTQVEPFVPELEHDLQEDDQHAFFTALFTHAPQALRMVCDANKGIKELYASHIRGPNAITRKIIYRRPIMSEFFPKIFEIVDHYSTIMDAIIWGHFIVYKDKVFIGGIGLITKTDFLTSINSSASLENKFYVRNPITEEILTSKVTVQGILDKFDNSIALDIPLIISHIYPKFSCFNFKDKLSYNRLCDRLERYVSELNDAINQKITRQNTRAAEANTQRIQPPPSPLTPPQIAQPEDVVVEPTITSVFPLTSGEDRRPYENYQYLTGVEIEFIVESVKLYKNITEKDVFTTKLIRLLPYTGLPIDPQVRKNHILRFINYYSRFPESFDEMKKNLETYITEFKSQEKQVGFNPTPGGGSITYHKTTDRYNYKGNNRVVWKKSTRKNSASFIKVKGKYVNIKSI